MPDNDFTPALAAGMAAAKRQRGNLLEAEIDRDELTLRIAEACLGMKRPPGTSAKDALAQLRAAEPEHVAGFDRAAFRAAEYFVECINTSGHFAEMN